MERDKLVNAFPTIRDAPVSRFGLNLNGSRNGILAVMNNRNICRGRQVADVAIDGHNGKRADSAVRMKTPCKARASVRVGRVGVAGKRVEAARKVGRGATRKVRVTVRCGSSSVWKAAQPKGSR